MLTKKGKYGLKAMAHLARFAARTLCAGDRNRHDPEHPQKIPRRHSLRAAQLRLRHLEDGKGRRLHARSPGGRRSRSATLFARSTGLSLRSLAPARPRYRPCDDCDDVERCSIRIVMQEAQQALSGVLDNRTLAQACEMAETIAALLRNLSGQSFRLGAARSRPDSALGAPPSDCRDAARSARAALHTPCSRHLPSPSAQFFDLYHT